MAIEKKVLFIPLEIRSIGHRMVSDFLKSEHSGSIKHAEHCRCLALTFMDNLVKTCGNQFVPKPKTVFSILLGRLTIPRTLRSRSSLHGRKLTKSAFSYTCYLPDPDIRWGRDYAEKLQIRQRIGAGKLHHINSLPDMKCLISFNPRIEKEWVTCCSIGWMCIAHMKLYMTYRKLHMGNKKPREK